MIIEFRRNKQQHAGILVKGETAEQVDQYKYLGIAVDNNLTWKPNTDVYICSKKFGCCTVDRAIDSETNGY